MGFFSDLFSGIKNVATKVYDSVKDPVSKIFRAVDPVIRGLGPIGNAVSTIGNTIGNLASGDLAGAAKSVGSGLLRQFGNPLRNIPEMDVKDDNLRFMFGVGGFDKNNSSSWILNVFDGTQVGISGIIKCLLNSENCIFSSTTLATKSNSLDVFTFHLFTQHSKLHF